ncbi:MAG TPA: hypothetical protein VGP22_02265, partial [Albitalea sp.]|nr:hypothetical protein [Albitalea sp.]
MRLVGLALQGLSIASVLATALWWRARKAGAAARRRQQQLDTELVRNIERLEQAERHLRERERDHRVMFEHNPLPLWIYDTRDW